MRRLGVLGMVLSGFLLASVLANPSPPTRAQEADGATPAAPEVVFERVADGVTPPLVAEQAGIDLQVARFAPEAAYTVPKDDETLLLVAVETGSLTVSSTTPLVVNRAANVTTAGAQAHELIAAGVAFTLATGDSFVRPPESEQELRNLTGEPASAFMASIERGSLASLQTAAPERDRSVSGVVVAVAVVVAPECPEGFDPVEVHPAATPGGGGGAGGAGGVAMAIAAAPECAGGGAAASMGAPTP